MIRIRPPVVPQSERSRRRQVLAVLTAILLVSALHMFTPENTDPVSTPQPTTSPRSNLYSPAVTDTFQQCP